MSTSSLTVEEMHEIWHALIETRDSVSSVLRCWPPIFLGRDESVYIHAILTGIIDDV